MTKTGVFFHRFCAALSLGMICYHFWYIVYLPYEPSINGIIHLGLAFGVLLLAGLAKKRDYLSLTLLPAALAISCYFVLDYERILENPTYPPQAAYVASIAAAIIAVYLTWKAFGMIFPLLCFLSILYIVFGPHLPGILRTPSVDMQRMVTLLAADVTSPWGLYGSMVILSANYLFLFIIFGSTLDAFGGLRFVMNAGSWAAGHFRSGAAALSIFSSAALGSVTGSTVANITVTGLFTIPLMKKSRYTAEQAAAIETAASSGGQILPPVMGATVFVMSGFTGIPYLAIVKASILSALIYFGLLLVYAELSARKRAILPLPPEPIDKRALLLSAPVFLLPLALLLILLFAGFSLMKTIFYCILSVAAIGVLLNFFQREDMKINWKTALDTCMRGAISGSQIAVVLAVIGMTVASIEITGLGIRMGSILVGLSMNNLYLLLLFTALASIILGCGLPSPAAYIICATILSPALIKLGVPLLQAHLFPLYYALFSHLTPPMGIGLMVACKMADSDFFKSALEAVKAALPSFLLPFIFIYSPGILLKASAPAENALHISATVLFFSTLAVVTNGWFAKRLSLSSWIPLFIAFAVLSVYLAGFHHFFLLLAGFLCLACALCLNLMEARRLEVQG
ncbi:MAG: TRAP transporter fused permease subunit [Candidatus Accumulibacter sp.]|jgi:TRAP transporter 4TM/12TM fusion protein|nr:TRAP transporter fused permease subunit [Accumulibacter sp.]